MSEWNDFLNTQTTDNNEKVFIIKRTNLMTVGSLWTEPPYGDERRVNNESLFVQKVSIRSYRTQD